MHSPVTFRRHLYSEMGTGSVQSQAQWTREASGRNLAHSTPLPPLGSTSPALVELIRSRAEVFAVLGSGSHTDPSLRSDELTWGAPNGQMTRTGPPRSPFNEAQAREHRRPSRQVRSEAWPAQQRIRRTRRPGRCTHAETITPAKGPCWVFRSAFPD